MRKSTRSVTLRSVAGSPEQVSEAELQIARMLLEGALELLAAGKGATPSESSGFVAEDATDEQQQGRGE